MVRKATKQDKAIQMLVTQSVMVPIDSLKRYPKNPRLGSVPEIEKAIRKNGFAKVLLVQKSTNYVIDGNHTWQAAVNVGLSEIPCSFLDVDDDTAARIVLAANRLNDLASYDNDVLAEVMKSLDGPEGTGYSQDDYDMLIEAVAGSITELPSNVRGDDAVFGDLGESPSALGDLEPGDNPGSFDDDDDPDLEGEFEKSEEDLKGAFALKNPDDVEYELVGDWHIPPLRPDMLATPDMIDADLAAWAGSATKDWAKRDQQWLYNVGVDSTSGMSPESISRMIVGFYTWDHYFESWWVYPDRWVAKLLNSKIKLALTPDWSMWAGKPKALALWSLYRQRWVGRYCQEAGIKIIPNIAWYGTDRKWFDRHVRGTLPATLPVVCFQLQTVDDLDPESKEYKELASMVEYVIKSCDAELTLVYVGKRGRGLIESLSVPQKIQMIDFRQKALGEQAKGRTKKKGM